MSYPDDRLYAETHEWHKVEGDTLTLGLTRFAVDSLTDVTYVEMKPPGTTFKAGEPIGEVESVKTTSDVYCACDGEIIEVNDAAASDPSLLNNDPHDAGWLVKVRIADRSGLDSCVGGPEYTQKHAH